MKTNKNQIISRNLLTLSVLTLLLLGAANASAQVRVRARINTPYGSVRVSNTHTGRYQMPRRHLEYRVSRHDKKMAKRLARYSGVAKRQILRLRRQGYTWHEIGRWLDVSPRVVRAARHQGSWRRFLNHERRYASCNRYYDD